jgi:HAD superfamily hydrolase (TIGR01490 family)
MALAIFDLDNTLLAGDSDYAWGEYLVATGKVDKEEYTARNDYFFEQYKLGKLDIHAFQALALGPLAGQNMETLAQWHQEFMASHIVPMRLPKADALLEKHQQQGDHLLIITATNRFITQPIADWLGINELIATEPEIVDGYYTGQMTGTPSYQEGKVSRLKEWLATRRDVLAGSYFYSDSHNDLPLLKIVDHPIAVDPDDTLRNKALEQGWPVISLR